jgi:hypothetical protein
LIPKKTSTNSAAASSAPHVIATFVGVWQLACTLPSLGHMVTVAVTVAVTFVLVAVVVGDGRLSLMTSPVPTFTVLLFESQ